METRAELGSSLQFVVSGSICFMWMSMWRRGAKNRFVVVIVVRAVGVIVVVAVVAGYSLPTRRGRDRYA